MDQLDLSAKKPLVLVTLVHGTWARGPSWRARKSDVEAPWCQTESPFISRLSDAFGDHGIEAGFWAMNWSGANSVLERFAQGERLAWICNDLRLAGDVDLHIVIAHSHGGNIVMEALEELSRRKQPPPAVVTIATPFLHTDDNPRLTSTPLPGCGTFLLLAFTLFWLVISVSVILASIGRGRDGMAANSDKGEAKSFGRTHRRRRKRGQGRAAGWRIGEGAESRPITPPARANAARSSA